MREFAEESIFRYWNVEIGLGIGSVEAALWSSRVGELEFSERIRDFRCTCNT